MTRENCRKQGLIASFNFVKSWNTYLWGDSFGRHDCQPDVNGSRAIRALVGDDISYYYLECLRPFGEIRESYVGGEKRACFLLSFSFFCLLSVFLSFGSYLDAVEFAPHRERPDPWLKVFVHSWHRRHCSGLGQWCRFFRMGRMHQWCRSLDCTGTQGCKQS